MADQLLERAREIAEGQIDFEGQRRSEFGATVVLAVVGAVAFIVGFFLQDIRIALYIGLAGTAFAFVLIVPSWPFFNQNPVKWLPVVGSEIKSHGIVVDGKVVG